MKLTGSLLSVGVGLALAGAPACGQFPPAPQGPGPYPPGMSMAGPPPGTSAFPPSVATLTPEGEPAPMAPPAGEGFAPNYALPTMPFGPGYCHESPCCPELLPAPTMIGAFMNYFATRTDLVVQTRLTSAGGPTKLVDEFYQVRYPVTSRGAFKISQNESPQPQSRIYYAFNYYADVRAKFQYAGGLATNLDGQDAGQVNPIGGPITNAFFKQVRIRQDILGMEVAIPDQIASVGVRCTMVDNQHDVEKVFNQAVAISANGDDPTTDGVPLGVRNGLDRWEVADLMLIGKVALCYDYSTGDVLSAGVAATIPTGHGVVSESDGRKLHPSLIQPFVGWLYQWGDWYVQGFHAGVIPTDSRDVYLLTNSVGIGYWCYKNECADDLFINGLAPTFEVHVDTPLRNVDSADEPIGSMHTVVLTTGLHVFTFGWASVTTGIGMVVSGPQPYGVVWSSAVNVRF